MAADQRRRRLASSSFIGCSFREQREQYRAKKKKLELQQDDLNMRSNISLEWDDKNKSVVAKREQIGILQRDLAPFTDVPHCHSSLADILTLPQEIFDLENLTSVLSYEVWQNHISETERNILTQLLPREAEPEKVVQELLSGDNFHFGNPFLKWGASLCSGKLHPDEVLQREQCIKANKKMYFLELQKYHNNMIEDLLTWKDRWDRCKDPEKEILPKIWRCRSRRLTSKHMQLSDTRYNDSEENNVATPESCSLATSEKACSNDVNPNLPGDSLGRIGFADSTVNNSSDGVKVVAKLKKGEKLQRCNIQLGDGAKYMSYIKISKEQHQRVKRTMKHTSNSIQPRSLNNVLGNLDALHVQPFEVFEEEERQKLHDYWLRLANKDIPAGYANWIKKKMKVQQMLNSLAQELKEKPECLEEDDEKDSSHNLPPEQTDDVQAVVSPNASAQEDGKTEVSHSFLEDQVADQAKKDEIAIALEDGEDNKTDNLLLRQSPNGTENAEEDDKSALLSAEEDHEAKIASISGRHQVNGMTLDSHDNDMIGKADDLPPILSDYPRDMNHMDIAVCQGDPPQSADDVWSAVSMPGSFFHAASLGHQYVSSSELSLAHPQVMEEQPDRLIPLQTDTQEKDFGRGDLLHRESGDLTFYSSFPNQVQSVLQEKNDEKQMLHRQPDDASLFGAYSTQDRNELLESFFKGHGGGLHYHHEQKRMGLDFHQPDNLMEDGQFSAQFRGQVDLPLPLEMRQTRTNDHYVDHNIQDSVYSDEGRYSIPKHLPINVQDWGVSTVRMLAPSQSHSSGGDLASQNWFSGENRAQVGWSGLEGAVTSSRSIGSQSNAADQSLFSVISAPARAPAAYESLGSAEQFMQPGTYSGLSGGIPNTSNILQQTADPLNYFSHHDGSGGRKTNNSGWMSVSHQSSGFHESMSKPFARSWNQ